jgi:hypothetical protein
MGRRRKEKEGKWKEGWLERGQYVQHSSGLSSPPSGRLTFPNLVPPKELLIMHLPLRPPVRVLPVQISLRKQAFDNRRNLFLRSFDQAEGLAYDHACGSERGETDEGWEGGEGGEGGRDEEEGAEVLRDEEGLFVVFVSDARREIRQQERTSS